MSFVASAAAAAAYVGGAVGLTGTAAVVGGGALIGAGVGGAYSAITGDGKILDSMLTGATIGGLGGWGLGAAGLGTAAGAAAGEVGGATALGGASGGAGATAGEIAAAANTPAVAAYGPPTSAMMPGAYDVGAAADAMFAMPNAPAVIETYNPVAGLDWSETGSGLSGNGAEVTAEDIAAAEKKGWWDSLSGGQKLATGLGATTLLGMLGSKQEGVNVPVDKGNIRPYEYSVAKRSTEGGKPYYFEPVQYDKYGRTTTPLDTSERNYFTQGYKALPTYKAAMGGQVPRYEQMQPGGLAAIQGLRDGYGASQTTDGNIPQFKNGGEASSDESFSDLMDQYRKLKALNIQIEPQLKDLADQKMRYSEEQGQPYYGMPERAYEQIISMSQPDMNRGIGQVRPGMVEGSQMMDRMRGNQQVPDVSLMPQSLNPKMLAGMGAVNTQLDDNTRLKLMAAGHRTPEDRGIDRIGAGLTRQLGRDSDISAYYERTPGTRDQMGGVRYNRRFAVGGMTEGDLGGYSDGGRLLKGPGDGVSDSIPASINNKQPARLADGEFVIPARIVSELGNGSTDAGAKRLYDMMDRIQNARKKTVGKGKVAVDSKAKKHLPA